MVVLLNGDGHLARWLSTIRKVYRWRRRSLSAETKPSLFLIDSVYRWRRSSPRRRQSYLSVESKLSLGEVTCVDRGYKTKEAENRGVQDEGSSKQILLPFLYLARKPHKVQTSSKILHWSVKNGGPGRQQIMCKDVVVGNEQKSVAFWQRIADYFAASPKLAGRERREPLHCKNRWHKINDLVCKFCGAYEAAAREKTSGQNENDILKQAHDLRHDQKWYVLSTEKSSKKRKGEDGVQSSTSYATDDVTGEAVEGMARPLGVKAAKRGGAKGVTLSQTKKLCVTCGVVSFVSQAKKKLCVVYGFLGSS
uniref:Myb-like domain-containing protein n=1 Tax=Brassica oleracea var. oleracea TaxID=109376 RepID=A0A0D3AWG6_BRAOL